MKSVLLACALATLAPAALAQVGGAALAPPPVKKLELDPGHCGAPVSPTSLYGFALLMTIQEVKDAAFCFSKNKYSVRGPTTTLIPYSDDLHAPQRYFEGVEMRIFLQPPSPTPEEELTLRFVGSGEAAKLVSIQIKKRARSTATYFDVDTEKRLLLTPYPGQSFASHPPEVKQAVVMALTPANVSMTEGYGMCYIGHQSKACGANLKLDYATAVFGVKKPVKEFQARLTYGSKVFPAILAAQETDAAGRPKNPPPKIAPPTAHQ